MSQKYLRQILLSSCIDTKFCEIIHKGLFVFPAHICGQLVY